MVLNRLFRAFDYEREDTRTLLILFSMYFKFSQGKIELTATDLSKRKRDFKRVKQLPVSDRY